MLARSDHSKLALYHCSIWPEKPRSCVKPIEVPGNNGSDLGWAWVRVPLGAGARRKQGTAALGEGCLQLPLTPPALERASSQWPCFYWKPWGKIGDQGCPALGHCTEGALTAESVVYSSLVDSFFQCGDFFLIIAVCLPIPPPPSSCVPIQQVLLSASFGWKQCHLTGICYRNCTRTSCIFKRTKLLDVLRSRDVLVPYKAQ